MSIFSKHKILVFDESVFMGRLLRSLLEGFEIGQVSICDDLAKVSDDRTSQISPKCYIKQ